MWAFLPIIVECAVVTCLKAPSSSNLWRLSWWCSIVNSVLMLLLIRGIMITRILAGKALRVLIVCHIDVDGFTLGSTSDWYGYRSYLSAGYV